MAYSNPAHAVLYHRMPMTSRETPESPIRKTEIFREQALQAWRGQEAEHRVLLDLSPGWMRWALVGIFIFAGVGVLLAGTTSIPNRANSTASARLSAGGDSVFVDAVFAWNGDGGIHSGQTMSFRPQEPGAPPIDLTILTVTPYPKPGNAVGNAAASAGSSQRVLVHGAVPAGKIEGDPRSFTGMGGTAHVSMGEETLLHLFRPRTPGGGKR